MTFTLAVSFRAGAPLAVHVTRPGGPAGAAVLALAAQRQLTESIGGTYQQLADLDIPGALLTLARAENATQLVLGRRHRSRLAALRPRTRIRSRVIRASSGPMCASSATLHRSPRGRQYPDPTGMDTPVTTYPAKPSPLAGS
jgi:two-component system, OmpR family, sensor histidine kinase KdpD